MAGSRTSTPSLERTPWAYEHRSSSQKRPQSSCQTGTMPTGEAGPASKSKSIPVTVGRAEKASKTDENHSRLGGNGHSDSKDPPLQCDVPMYGTRGWKIGDVGVGILTEGLGNPRLQQREHAKILHGNHGKYMEKPRYFVVENPVGQRLSVYLMTTFGDTDPAVLREQKTYDETFGERPKLNDCVQAVALHKRDGKPVTKEELCFQKGEKQIEWTSTCRAPSKKISYVQLASMVTIGFDFTKLRKMGEVTPETLSNLIDIQEDCQTAKTAGKRMCAKRKRESSTESQTSMPPPTPNFSDIATVEPRRILQPRLDRKTPRLDS